MSKVYKYHFSFGVYVQKTADQPSVFDGINRMEVELYGLIEEFRYPVLDSIEIKNIEPYLKSLPAYKDAHQVIPRIISWQLLFEHEENIS